MASRFHLALLCLLCLVGLCSLDLAGGMPQPAPLLAAAPTRIDPTPLPPPPLPAVRTPRPPQARPPVATLLLTVPVTDTALFSVVQWQDAQGGWHDIEGWRGTVVGGKTIWWVAEKDWGKGPYRWVIYQHETTPHQIIAVSDLFLLPTRPGELKRIFVQVELSAQPASPDERAR
jgi:hypothetical protein